MGTQYTLHLTNQVGMQVDVGVDSIDAVYTEMRRFGSLGWTSGDIPAGGFRLPYEMADTFDFALIGARAFTLDAKGDEPAKHCVEYRGHVYTRRDLPATAKIKKPVIKYSRGANAVDDETVREGDPKAIQFVTLIQFEGKGHAIAPLMKKSGRPAPEAAREKSTSTGAVPAQTAHQTPAHGAEPTPIEKLLANLDEAAKRRIEGIAKSKKLWDTPALCELILKVTDGKPIAPGEQVQDVFLAIRDGAVAA